VRNATVVLEVCHMNISHVKLETWPLHCLAKVCVCGEWGLVVVILGDWCIVLADTYLHSVGGGGGEASVTISGGSRKQSRGVLKWFAHKARGKIFTDHAHFPKPHFICMPA